MNSPVDLIKERINIVDVISAYIPLTPAGKNYKGKSPFKQERTPSFYVSSDKGLYHCFSTGKGGDMFTFVQEMEGLDFKGALKVLADRAGISLKNWNPKDREEKDKLYEIMEAATVLFESWLPKYPEVLAYIQQRGVEDTVMKDFRVGYAPDGWRSLYDALKDKFTDKDLALVGLIKTTEKGAYDTFRDRIMFPISDTSGRVIAFSGRIFKDDGTSGKYVNSPDTPLFNKSDVLFAIDKAKHYIRKYNFTTIVEGQFDVIMLHQAGFKNTVAVSGTALADSLVGRDRQVNNLGVVKRLSHNLVLAFDSDTAGVNAAKRSANIAMSLGMDVKIVDIEGGKDPAELIQEYGKDAWSKILRQAVHVILFYAKKIKDTSKDERDLGKRIKNELLPEILFIESDIEKSYFIKKVAEITGISEKNISSDLSKIKTPERKTEKIEPEHTPTTTREPKGEELEKEIWGMYMMKDKNEEMKRRIVEITGEDSFHKLFEKYNNKESEFIFGEKDYLEGIDEKFNNFKKFYIHKELMAIKEKMKAADRVGDEVLVEKLMHTQQALEKERDGINNSRHINNR